MAGRTCHNCVYCCDDPCLWLDLLWLDEPLLPRCANHPQWPGQLHEVPGVPCRNYRPRPTLPEGDDVRMIPLAEGGYAYVDAADYEWLSQWTWHLCSSGYAGRRERDKLVLMHRQILSPPKGMLVDHVDGNRSNNCRANIRVCTRAQNMHNKRKHAGFSSQYKGVGYCKETRRWRVRLWFQGQPVRLGYFRTEVEAARAYDRMAVELFGPFAHLNFPREWPPERRAQVHAQRQEPDEETSKTKKVRRSEGKKGRGKKRSARAGTQGRGGAEVENARRNSHGPRAQSQRERARRRTKRPRRAAPPQLPTANRRPEERA